MIADIKRKLITEFTFMPQSKEKARQGIRLINLTRLEFMLYVGFPIVFIHVIIFYFFRHESDPATQSWRYTLLATHSILSVLFMGIGLSAILINKKSKQNGLLARLLPQLTCLIFISAGAFIAGVDQLVTPAIAPFILVTLICALLLYMHPFQAGLYYTFGFLVLVLMLNIHQHNNSILLSNLVNGLTTVAIGWALSVTLWINQLRRFEKDLIIKNQQNKLTQHNKMLSERTSALNLSNKTKDKLFSIIAHDVRGPLSNLTVMVQLLKNGEISDDEFKEILPDLTQEITQTNELMENLLNWSKTNLHDTVAKPLTLDPKAIVDEIILLYKTQITNKKLNIINGISELHLVFADRNMIQIIIRNLFSNAIKFSHPGGKITLESTSINNHIHISVSDEGLGLQKEKIELLMTDDYNSSPGTAGEKGTGLGLILCREFVKKNGGTLSISSIEGKGSTFSFSLPVG